MRFHRMRRVLLVGAIAGGGVAIGFGVSPAGATGQTSHGDLTGLIIPFGQLAGPFSNISASCPSWVSNDFVNVDFNTGNGVDYGQNNTNNTLSGGNVEGDADLEFFASVDSNGIGIGTPDAVYEGHTHAWFGTNTHTKGFYTGDTADLHDVGIAGTSGTIIIQSNGGETVLDSGHLSGWGHTNVTCG